MPDDALDVDLPPFPFSPAFEPLRRRLIAFMREHVLPAEAAWTQQQAELTERGERWARMPKVLDELKAKAKAAGLWNLFLPNSEHFKHSHGLSNLDYAPLAEIMGHCFFASEVFNCSAPDTGNMEVLARYGSAAQRERWLRPLLEGEIRSAFLMTEPAVASSDATNIALEVRRVGDEYELNGVKWWSSGIMDPRCEVLIVMGRMAGGGGGDGKHGRHCMVVVPRRAAGVRVARSLTVFGYDDAPHGHGEVHLERVRVPLDAMLLGEGRGFEIAQGRLGPGRVHHCMRAIGLSERCLAALCERAASRTAFGTRLAQKGTVQATIAECRMEIDQARLLVLSAAHAMDAHGNKAARQAIAMIKVVAPRIGCLVADRAIQIHGGAGVSQDTFLAQAYAGLRTLRLADGPDEVHLGMVGKLELKRALTRAGKL